MLHPGPLEWGDRAGDHINLPLPDIGGYCGMDRLDCDVVVVGAGHAGCEAALASARMGASTVLLTISLDTIAYMSCNPAIGGVGKGQLVREIDALGGEMGKVIDSTGIQFRMINTGKGPAMHSPRAQADKALYRLEFKRRLEEQENLLLRQEMVDAVLIEGGRVSGVRGRSGLTYRAPAVILSTGTFLKGVMHFGTERRVGGRMGELSAEMLSGTLADAGLEIGRLKTGTPPRLNGRTLDLSRMSAQHGDPVPQPFSFSSRSIEQDQLPCYMTETNARTHEIIRSGLDRSPLYDGRISSTGPRYCPSIEVKIVRFADKARHQLYIEPEGRSTLECYCNGLFTSLPRDVQDEMVHSIPGLERAQIMRYGYAIEYDYVPPTQLWPSLEVKTVEGLFHAGQINGTSGYEEAAAQGLLAGLNAVRKLRGLDPLILRRDEAYTGVMIDDLVTKGVREPYRMFTSLAEFRLLLRHDNADRRLMRYGHDNGLISEDQWRRLKEKEAAIAALRARLDSRRNAEGKSLSDLLRRPGTTLEQLMEGHPEIAGAAPDPRVLEQAEIETKYEGYLQRQADQVEKFQRLEDRRIPQWLDYDGIPELRFQARDRLKAVRPGSIGQASRIEGVSPADVSILLVYVEGRRRAARAT